MKSDIFDAFVKIAQEKGMISNDADAVKKKLEQTHRADSLSISDIEALYGVKPDSPKNMEYEHNIMEVAHPNSVIISPSHDKINGLVENNVERQNIMLNIVHKQNNGQSTQHKYAEKDLVLSLVSIANDLDNHNKDELRVLADACLMQLHQKKSQKSLNKFAVWWMIPSLVAGILGAIEFQQHADNIATALKPDSDRLIEAIDNALNENSNLGVGHEYDVDLKNDINGMKIYLNQFWEEYEKDNSILRSLEKPKDAQEVLKKVDDPNTKEVLDAKNRIMAITKNMKPYMERMQSNLNNMSYIARHTKDTGAITKGLEYLHLQGPKKSLFGDKLTSISNAIPPILTDLDELINNFDELQAQDKAREAAIKTEMSDNKDKITTEHPDITKEKSKLNEGLSGMEQFFTSSK